MLQRCKPGSGQLTFLPRRAKRQDHNSLEVKADAGNDPIVNV